MSIYFILFSLFFWVRLMKKDKKWKKKIEKASNIRILSI